MRIPQVGDQVLYVLESADQSINRPITVRPAMVVSVSDYTPNSASVNLVVTLDGSNDEHMLGVDQKRFGLQIWKTSVMFSDDKQSNTWHWLPPTFSRCETFTTLGPITHGREIIRKGAKGVWDQSKNTLTFSSSDIDGLHRDHMPVYEANSFIDLHCARLEAPAGHGWMTKHVERIDDSERADERDAMLQSMAEMRDWEYGMMMRFMADRMGFPMDEMPLTPPRLRQWPKNWVSLDERKRLAKEFNTSNEGRPMELQDGKSRASRETRKLEHAQ